MKPIAKQKNMLNRIKDLEEESKTFQLKYQRERRKGKNRKKEIKRVKSCLEFYKKWYFRGITSYNTKTKEKDIEIKNLKFLILILSIFLFGFIIGMVIV